MTETKGQCFNCYDAAMFQFFGQTGSFDPIKIQKDFVKDLEDGEVIRCITCCAKATYVKTSDGKWKEERE